MALVYHPLAGVSVAGQPKSGRGLHFRRWLAKLTPVALAYQSAVTRARSEVVITPPCHGGDRRFKSGRARQFGLRVVERNKSSGSLGVRATFLLPKHHARPIGTESGYFSFHEQGLP